MLKYHVKLKELHLFLQFETSYWSFLQIFTPFGCYVEAQLFLKKVMNVKHYQGDQFHLQYQISHLRHHLIGLLLNPL